ncbi:hypothetical protein EJ05DRAFT_500617 [Pseudovirgaria hyperparasitica]|uniref:Uncharacterized protein n=1 Tax=Pseudovirgaria hyperparasitica TaxID=470096 RepID=A0A6A6W7C0_9PEZI|nr:uncharacterized protein EJ05DRAFT_500617 [Pseudovirgaria hyperparasitica]KAF2758099.1 hypothetical protein EJ05DRAFT_500617 [Pseudovirgaria hyperparasitica]
MSARESIRGEIRRMTAGKSGPKKWRAAARVLVDRTMSTQFCMVITVSGLTIGAIVCIVPIAAIGCFYVAQEKYKERHRSARQQKKSKEENRVVMMPPPRFADLEVTRRRKISFEAQCGSEESNVTPETSLQYKSQPSNRMAAKSNSQIVNPYKPLKFPQDSPFFTILPLDIRIMVYELVCGGHHLTIVPCYTGPYRHVGEQRYIQMNTYDCYPMCPERHKYETAYRWVVPIESVEDYNHVMSLPSLVNGWRSNVSLWVILDSRMPCLPVQGLTSVLYREAVNVLYGANNFNFNITKDKLLPLSKFMLPQRIDHIHRVTVHATLVDIANGGGAWDVLRNLKGLTYLCIIISGPMPQVVDDDLFYIKRVDRPSNLREFEVLIPWKLNEELDAVVRGGDWSCRIRRYAIS